MCSKLTGIHMFMYMSIFGLHWQLEHNSFSFYIMNFLNWWILKDNFYSRAQCFHISSSWIILSLQTRPYNTCVHDAWSRKLVATNQFIDLRLIANKGRFTVIPSKLCRFWIVIPACIYFLFLVIFFTPNWTTMMNACTRLKNKSKSNQEIVKSGDDFLCYG